MKNIKSLISIAVLASCSSNTVSSMGLRSFVALPVEKEGAVVRFTYEYAKDKDTDQVISSMAYGLSNHQTLMLGLPYRISPTDSHRQGDISALYRHIIWRDDQFSGTSRLGLLGGAIIPTEGDRDAALQAGFVLTHFKGKNEIDIDAVYQSGMKQRVDKGRYDISWQHRLSPSEMPDWGLPKQVNSILELNGRWTEGNNMTHQVTAGLQWIHQDLVLEGGIAKDINNAKETRYILSTRFHF